jgi:K+-transporting ATPase c subunit
VASKIPRFIPHTKPTPPDESDTIGQVFFQIRMNPTPPDHSDRMHPPHNPSVVGSIPTGPTNQALRHRAQLSGYSMFLMAEPGQSSAATHAIVHVSGWMRNSNRV